MTHHIQPPGFFQAALLEDIGRTPVERKLAKLLDAGKWDTALAAANIDPAEPQGAAIMFVLGSISTVLGRLHPALELAAAKLFMARVLRLTWGSEEALFAAALLAARQRVPVVDKFFMELSSRVPKGDDPLPGADWDTGVIWIDWASPSDALARWYARRIAALPPSLAALIVEELPHTVKCREREAGVPPRPTTLLRQELDILCSVGLYRTAPLEETLSQLKVDQLRAIVQEYALDVSARRKAELTAAIAAQLRPQQANEILKRHRLSPACEIVFDDQQYHHIREINRAVLEEARLALGMLWSFWNTARVLHEFREQQQPEPAERIVAGGIVLEARLEVPIFVPYIRPGPDRSCPYCPKEPVRLQTGREPLPPFHPGCRCMLDRDYNVEQ